MCATCPARPRCRAYALATLPAAGVWGGLTPEELHRLAGAGPGWRRGGGGVMAAGTVYLLHFDQPYKHDRHYVGNPES